MLNGKGGSLMRRIVVLICLALSLSARAEEGLRYRMQMWMRDDPAPMETVFWLHATPATRSHNRVQKPRMGGWHLEAERSQGTPYAQALLLGRAERLLYLAGPAPQTRPEPISLRFGGRALPVWSLELPRGMHASVVLVEISPKLLALCDLSARFPHGEVARVELHLEELGATSNMAPAEAGTRLLTTLMAWSGEVAQEGAATPGQVMVQ
jgi:hypothetical protein